MLPLLPPRLAKVRVPIYFSPSRWHTTQACPVSVWGAASATLLEPIAAIVGQVLHEARAAILEARAVGLGEMARAKEIVTAVVAERERRLAESPEYRDVVPFAEAIGKRRWLDQLSLLLRWAREAEQLPLGRPSRHKAPAKGELQGAEPDRFELGVEVRWVSNSLRLRGRPDEARRPVPEGGVEIVDYKTGFVTDAEGNILPSVRWQMWLYLLMAENLTGRPASAVVLGPRSTHVPWTAAAKLEAAASCEAFAVRFPAGMDADAGLVASPGPHCRGCRLRPACGAYLESAPSWWENTGDHPRPLPFDVWGEVLEANETASGVELRLRAPGGRNVVVRGVPRSLAAEMSLRGRTLYMFDLQPSEDVLVHGRAMQPRTFHLRSPDGVRPSAVQARIFMSP